VSADEREQLEARIRKGNSPAQRLLKARYYVKADVSEYGEVGQLTSRIIRPGRPVVHGLPARKQLVEEGCEAVLSRKHARLPGGAADV